MRMVRRRLRKFNLNWRFLWFVKEFLYDGNTTLECMLLICIFSVRNTIILPVALLSSIFNHPNKGKVDWEFVQIERCHWKSMTCIASPKGAASQKLQVLSARMPDSYISRPFLIGKDLFSAMSRLWEKHFNAIFGKNNKDCIAHQLSSKVKMYDHVQNLQKVWEKALDNNCKLMLHVLDFNSLLISWNNQRLERNVCEHIHCKSYPARVHTTYRPSLQPGKKDLGRIVRDVKRSKDFEVLSRKTRKIGKCQSLSQKRNQSMSEKEIIFF